MRLIDADALINTLQDLFDKREQEARFTGNRGVTVTWNDAIYHIKTAPTIEPKKQKIAYLVNPNPYGECSECGWLIDSRDDFNFCPNCGARIERRGSTE